MNLRRIHQSNVSTLRTIHENNSELSSIIGELNPEFDPRQKTEVGSAGEKESSGLIIDMADYTGYLESAVQRQAEIIKALRFTLFHNGDPQPAEEGHVSQRRLG